MRRLLLIFALLPYLAYGQMGGNSSFGGNSSMGVSTLITQAATPTFSPSAGAVSNPTTVTASTATSGCGPYIYFDTNPTPTTNQTTYSVTTAVTLYAYVHGCPGYTDSAVASASYTIASGTVATPLLVPNAWIPTISTANYSVAAPSPTLVFGEQGTGTSSPAVPISISNVSNSQYCTTLGIGCGSGTLTVSSMTVTGTNASDFVVTGSCATIASGSDCEPTIRFTPTASAGTDETATLTVSYSGASVSSQTMSLTGTSTAETTIASVPVSTNFTDLAIGTTDTQVTSAANPFTSADVGKTLLIQGGTGFTKGVYTISSVTSGVATLSAAAGTASSTGGIGQIALALAAGNYQLTSSITCGQSCFLLTGSPVDINLDGYTLTYGNTSSAAQINDIMSATYNLALTVHGGVLASGAGTNTFGAAHSQSSVIGYTASYSMAGGINIFNLDFEYNIQYANAVEDNNGNMIAHDIMIHDTAVGTCASVACRGQLEATPFYQENVSTQASGGTQYYNITQNGGPQGGLQAAAPGALFHHNYLNPGNASGNNTNDFALYCWGQACNIHHNVVMIPVTSSTNGRGLQISAAQTSGLTGANVHNNLLNTYETPTNSEYSGCQVGGAYGLQFDDNPVGPNTAQNNTVYATGKVCSAEGLRMTDTEYTTNVSQNSTYIGTRASGAGTCTRAIDQGPEPGCAYASVLDGPTGFTSINDVFTGDSGDVLFDVSGGSGVTYQSPTFNKGANPSLFNTFAARNGTTSEGGGPVSNVHFVDSIFNTGTSATDTDVPVYNTGNMGAVSFYIDWTQTMTVLKASGPAASGAVVTWTDTLANTYTCTTNGSGVCSVALTQYRANNDTSSNAEENRNPYSLSVPFSGCTTYTQSGITISATGALSVVLSGC
jgi:hypothetical protein